MTSTLLNHMTEAPPDDITAARAGDREAFGRLYREHRETVYRFAYFRCRTVALAEDITQMTFLRALARMETFEWRGKDIGAWFVTIARNLLFDHYKSSYYQLELSTETPVGPEVVMRESWHSNTSEDEVIETWESQVLRRFLNMLGHEQRVCLTARFLNGLSVAETAVLMDKNEGAIKALQYRAVRTMGRMMQEAGNPLGYPLP